MLDAFFTFLLDIIISHGPDLVYVLVEKEKSWNFSAVCSSLLKKLILCGILSSA